MRKVSLKRLFAAGLSEVLALASLPALAASEPGAGKHVVILHTNDLHGSLIGSSSVIGADSIAALKQSEDAILLDAGDATQGLPWPPSPRGKT